MLSLVSKDLRETEAGQKALWKNKFYTTYKIILWKTEKPTDSSWDFVSTMELHSIITILINLQGAHFNVISSLFLFNLNDSQ